MEALHWSVRQTYMLSLLLCPPKQSKHICGTQPGIHVRPTLPRELDGQHMLMWVIPDGHQHVTPDAALLLSHTHADLGTKLLPLTSPSVALSYPLCCPARRLKVSWCRRMASSIAEGGRVSHRLV